ncbi:MFS transporter [Kitasatospora sp. NPDC001175]|uniref:MFS transporter n=1 Tax=Kitasatospora sp. NPDC001175 TaxID=3157103 RepID=UPI003CFF7F67
MTSPTARLSRSLRRPPEDGGRETRQDRPEGFNRKLIAPMLLGSVLNPVNSSMIAVALIPIGTAFGTPPSQTAWLVSALYLATAVGQPVVGRLVDTYGPRRLYLIGTSLVGIAGLLGALAPSLGFLIAARVLLGFGTSAAYPASMHLTRSEARRTGGDSPAGVLTALAIANQTVAVIGPTLGGLLIGAGGWRTMFTVNIPLSLACLVLGTLRLPRHPAPDREQTSATGRVDLAGMALFAAMLVSLMLFLMSPRLARWYLPVLAAVATTGFAVRELRVPEPFIDLRVLGGNGPMLATFVRQLLSYTAAYAFMYGFTPWLEEGRGLNASVAGLVLLPLSLSALLVSGATGRRSEIRGKLVAGGLFQIAACAALLLVDSGSSLWLLVAVGVLMGIPQGLNGLANQNALYHQADPARIGSAAGLLRTFMYLGAMTASAATAAFFGEGARTGGLHRLALFMLAGAVLLLAVTLLDRSLHRVGLVTARARA